MASTFVVGFPTSFEEEGMPLSPRAKHLPNGNVSDNQVADADTASGIFSSIVSSRRGKLTAAAILVTTFVVAIASGGIVRSKNMASSFSAGTPCMSTKSSKAPTTKSSKAPTIKSTEFSKSSKSTKALSYSSSYCAKSSKSKSSKAVDTMTLVLDAATSSPTSPPSEKPVAPLVIAEVSGTSFPSTSMPTDKPSLKPTTAKPSYQPMTTFSPTVYPTIVASLEGTVTVSTETTGPPTLPDRES